jgi:Heterokaryon incompatibility protein (HET)
LEDGAFRLLILDPGVEEMSITCQLQEFEVSNPPQYEALSYVWGQDPPIHKIEVNKHLVNIRTNLYCALRRIRHRTQHVPLWVDSVCINQTNESERDKQVREMAKIFQKAQNVCVWLGEEDSTSAIAMRYILQVVDPKFTLDLSSWKHHRYGLTAINKLLDRDWFKRGWVLQEAAFASSAVLFCGDLQIHMADFYDAVSLICGWLSGMTNTSQMKEEGIAMTFDLNNFRDSPATRLLELVNSVFLKSPEGNIIACKLPLEAIVESSTFSETTDLRDSVYALLHLANDVNITLKDNSSCSIVPSYGKCLLEVFADFILHCCRRSDSLDILCRPWAPVPMSTRPTNPGSSPVDTSLVSNIPSCISSRDGLPFGNPSWRTKHRLHGRSLVGSSRRPSYNAHYNSKPIVRVGFDKTIGTWDGSLRVMGILLGEIIERSIRMADGIILQECMRLLGARNGDKYGYAAQLPEFVWRTLCANRDCKGERAPSIYRKAMFDLMQFGCKKGIGGLTSIDTEELLGTNMPPHTAEFLQNIREVVWNRRSFRGKTSNDRSSKIVGLIPQHAQEGDMICILYGCSVPVVIRKHFRRDGSFYWQLIGEAYVHGYMEGEAICNMVDNTLSFEESEFELC